MEISQRNSTSASHLLVRRLHQVLSLQLRRALLVRGFLQQLTEVIIALFICRRISISASTYLVSVRAWRGCSTRSVFHAKLTTRASVSSCIPLLGRLIGPAGGANGCFSFLANTPQLLLYSGCMSFQILHTPNLQLPPFSSFPFPRAEKTPSPHHVRQHTQRERLGNRDKVKSVLSTVLFDHGTSG